MGPQELALRRALARLCTLYEVRFDAAATAKLVEAFRECEGVEELEGLFRSLVAAVGRARAVSGPGSVLAPAAGPAAGPAAPGGRGPVGLALLDRALDLLEKEERGFDPLTVMAVFPWPDFPRFVPGPEAMEARYCPPRPPGEPLPPAGAAPAALRARLRALGAYCAFLAECPASRENARAYWALGDLRLPAPLAARLRAAAEGASTMADGAFSGDELTPDLLLTPSEGRAGPGRCVTLLGVLRPAPAGGFLLETERETYALRFLAQLSGALCGHLFPGCVALATGAPPAGPAPGRGPRPLEVVNLNALPPLSASLYRARARAALSLPARPGAAPSPGFLALTRLVEAPLETPPGSGASALVLAGVCLEDPGVLRRLRGLLQGLGRLARAGEALPSLLVLVGEFVAPGHRWDPPSYVRAFRALQAELDALPRLRTRLRVVAVPGEGDPGAAGLCWPRAELAAAGAVRRALGPERRGGGPRVSFATSPCRLELGGTSVLLSSLGLSGRLGRASLNGRLGRLWRAARLGRGGGASGLAGASHASAGPGSVSGFAMNSALDPGLGPAPDSAPDATPDSAPDSAPDSDSPSRLLALTVSSQLTACPLAPVPGPNNPDPAPAMQWDRLHCFDLHQPTHVVVLCEPRPFTEEVEELEVCSPGPFAEGWALQVRAGPAGEGDGAEEGAAEAWSGTPGRRARLVRV